MNAKPLELCEILMEVSKSVNLNGYMYIDNSQGQITKMQAMS